jgi:hypothetical protein
MASINEFADEVAGDLAALMGVGGGFCPFVMALADQSSGESLKGEAIGIHAALAAPLEVLVRLDDSRVTPDAARRKFRDRLVMTLAPLIEGRGKAISDDGAHGVVIVRLDDEGKAVDGHGGLQ